MTRDEKAGEGAYWLDMGGARLERVWLLGGLELDANLETIIETLSRDLVARGYRMGWVNASPDMCGLHVAAYSYEIAPNSYGSSLGDEEYLEIDYLGKTYHTSHGPATCPGWARAS